MRATTIFVDAALVGAEAKPRPGVKRLLLMDTLRSRVATLASSCWV